MLNHVDGSHVTRFNVTLNCMLFCIKAGLLFLTSLLAQSPLTAFLHAVDTSKFHTNLIHYWQTISNTIVNCRSNAPKSEEFTHFFLAWLLTIFFCIACSLERRLPAILHAPLCAP